MTFTKQQKMLGAIFAAVFVIGSAVILFRSQTGSDEALVVEPTVLDGKYAMSDVATHKSGDSCWSAINGGVYDLTSWVISHPGGKLAILGLCGKDGSMLFNGVHGGKKPMEDKLVEFRIGDLE